MMMGFPVCCGRLMSAETDALVCFENDHVEMAGNLGPYRLLQ